MCLKGCFSVGNIGEKRAKVIKEERWKCFKDFI